jgi:hypothetical protein
MLGDLNATLESATFQKLLSATGLIPAGTPQPTHDSGLKMDYVLLGSGIAEKDYTLCRGRSDHRIVDNEVELEV